MVDQNLNPIQMQESLPSWQKIMSDPYFGHWFPIWINNAMENYQYIKNEFQTRDKCLTSHPRPMNRPALIIGRGPSAEKVGPLLKNWQHPIFVTFSNALFPLAHGVEPAYICAFDSVLTMDRLRHHKWNKSILFTHPNIDSRMIKDWKWEKYYYRRVFPGSEFFEVVFPLMYPFIRIGIRFTGSVVNNAISIANFLGFSPLFLIGCDLSWMDDKATSATNYRLESDGSLIANDTQPLIAAPNSTFEINGKRTDERMLFFKEGLLHIWASDQNQIIDCSNGILRELPQANIEEVVKKQGRGFQSIYKDPRTFIQLTEEYSKWLKEFMDQKKAEGYVSIEE